MEKKLKVLLVDMEYERDELNEPINIDSIIHCIDLDVKNRVDMSVVYRKIEQSLIQNQEEFDVVLISSKISSYNQMINLIEMHTNSIIIIGGALAIYESEHLAKIHRNIIINIGECETNINSLLRLALKKPSIQQFKREIVNTKIPNLCFYDEYSDSVKYTQREVANLSQLAVFPQHHTLNKVVDGNGLIRMETSRGCPWNKCRFCVMPWRFANNKWREFPTSKIESELKYLLSNNSGLIYFTDEDFIGNKRHLFELCNIIIKLRPSYKNIRFGGSTSVWTLVNLGEDLDKCLELLREAGIVRLFVGIESGSNSQLKRYGKGVSAEDNKLIISKLKKYDFILDYGFIMFDAETNMSELKENLDFILNCDLQSNISNFSKKLRVVPHTHLYEEYFKKNYIISDINLNENYYEYCFLDKNIELVCKYIEKINDLLGIETYRLQAISRSSLTEYTQSEVEYKLKNLRNLEYIFLRRCVEYYEKNSKLSVEFLDELLFELRRTYSEEIHKRLT